MCVSVYTNMYMRTYTAVQSKRRYLLTLQVSRYCLVPLHSSIYVRMYVFDSMTTVYDTNKNIYYYVYMSTLVGLRVYILYNMHLIK